MISVSSDDVLTRLDRFLVQRLGAEYSRSQIGRMIKAGLVTLNGAPALAASEPRAGDRIQIAPPPRQCGPVQPLKAAPSIDVLFADHELIVINKPPAMVVHHAPGHSHSTLVDGLLARFPELAAMVDPDGVARPGIVHRLDQDTSGVMVVARTPFARVALSRQFRERTVRKIYLAVVRGIVARDRLTIERPLGRHPVERKRMSVRSRAARDALSRVTVLARFGDRATLVRVVPETGRTHQIRVHLASIGHPCLGDSLYGGGDRPEAPHFGRQALHALALEVDHPRTGERLEFAAPPAPDLAAFLIDQGLEPAPQTIRRWVDAE